MSAKGLARVAAAEAIGAQRREAPRGRHPAGDLVGHGLDEVGHRDHRPVALEDLRDPGRAGGLVGVEAVPPLGGEGLLPELLVAGGREEVGGHVVVLCQLGLCLPGGQVG